MSFISDISKQAHEVVFPRKNFKISHPSLTFNNITVAQVGSPNILDFHWIAILMNTCVLSNQKLIE